MTKQVAIGTENEVYAVTFQQTNAGSQIDHKALGEYLAEQDTPYQNSMGGTIPQPPSHSPAHNFCQNY
jgi:hypothetical protein